VKFPQDLRLGFEWPSRQAVHVVLPVALVLSVLLHLGAVFLFDVRPRAVAEAPVRVGAVVYFLSADTGADPALIRESAARDPSLYSPSVGSLPESPVLGATSYDPLYLSSEAEFQARPIDPPPAGIAVVPVEPIRNPAAIATEAPLPSAAPSRVRFAQSLESLLPPGTASDVQFPDYTQDRAPAPCRFLIGVSVEGQVEFSFLLESSGVEDVDEAAQRFLHRLEFLPAKSPDVLWDVVTFIWGQRETE